MVKRIETYFGNHIDEERLNSLQKEDISRTLSKIMEERFSGRGRWSNVPTHKILASMIRRRPRDLVKLCHAAAKEADRNNNQIITTIDFNLYLINTRKNAFKTSAMNLKQSFLILIDLLLNMKPNKKQRRTADTMFNFQMMS